jgi:hypothetical protein
VLVHRLLEAARRQRAQLSGRRVEQRQRRAILVQRQRRQPEWVARLQRVFIDQRARRDQPDDLAPHQLLAGTGHLHLIADGHLVSGRDQPRDVAARRMVRHARHRHPIVALGAAGQRDAEKLRGHPRIVEEELVEIAQPEEEQRVLRLRFGLVVLPQHRRDRGRRPLCLL